MWVGACRKWLPWKLRRWQPEKYHRNVIFGWFSVRHYCWLPWNVPRCSRFIVNIKAETKGLRVKEEKLGRSEPERGKKDNHRTIGWQKLQVWVPGYGAYTSPQIWPLYSHKYSAQCTEGTGLLRQRRTKHRLKRRTYSSSGPGPTSDSMLMDMINWNHLDSPFMGLSMDTAAGFCG